MLLAYNSNGLAHHRPADGIELLAEIGYRGIGITLDHGWLDPFTDDLPRQLELIDGLLKRHKMRSVIETGARFLLDPRLKHEPTLLSAHGRERRLDFYRRAIDIAERLGSDCVSIWSGVLREPIDDRAAMKRLVDGLRDTCRYAEARGVLIGFEPEPGMFIDTMQQFQRLFDQFDSPALRLTLDLGHLHCQGETPIADHIHRWRDRLVNVHIEDMRRGVHEHLMFGEGEIDFAPVMGALAEINYDGLVQVELSRHSHMGPEAARRAFEFLSPLLGRPD